jgi:hypothetical protein
MVFRKYNDANKRLTKRAAMPNNHKQSTGFVLGIYFLCLYQVRRMRDPTLSWSNTLLPY